MRQLALFTVLFFPLPSLVHAQEAPALQEVTKAQEQSITKGIRWLLDNQSPTGLWG